MVGNGNIVLSFNEKMAYQADLANVHDIFKRPFLIYRQAERVVMSENLQFNYAYGDNQADSDTVSYNINSGIFSARIWYMPGMSANKMSLTTSTSDREFSARGEPQLRFNNDKNYIRLKLDISGYGFIKGCKTVQIDSGNYNVFSAYEIHGLFVPQFYNVWLEQNS